VGALDAQGDEELNLGSEAREVPTTLRLFELNVSFMMVKFGRVEQDQRML
jgi:hypothetical protein